MYDRYEEYHYEKAWTTEEIKELIEMSGLELINVYDECSFSPPHEKSTRIHFVAREVTKKV